MRSRLFFFFCALIICLNVVIDCEQSAKSETMQLLPFSQIDSLIGDEYAISQTDKIIRPPIGFSQPNDSILNEIRQGMTDEQGYGDGKTLINCFLDTINQAGFLISKIDGLSLRGDTAAFFGKYRATIHGLYGAENITEASGWIGSIFIANFVISDGTTARFYAICLDSSEVALELSYFLPETQLASIIESIHSSVASIK
ncbi:MAG: hypothetical protein ABIE07_08875 [Candidatus Zixiibacteriota bacterium]